MNIVFVIIVSAALAVIAGHIYSSLMFRKQVLQKIKESQGYLKTGENNRKYRKEVLSFLDYSNHAMEEQYILQLMNQQAQLDALQSQINPHFLYNTLDTIRGKAYEDNAFEVADMTEMLALLFRYTVGQKNELITIEEELQSVDYYIGIQQYRFNAGYDVIKEIEEQELLEYMIPKLILQPIVENTFKYGFADKRSRICIKIQVFGTQNRTVIRIEDNGRGMSLERLQQINDRLERKEQTDNSEKKLKGGIALYNINARIKLLYGKEYGIAVYSVENEGTVVEISLPVRKKKDENRGD